MGTGIYYPIPVHRQKPFLALGYGDATVPGHRAADQRGRQHPGPPSLTDDEVATVIAAVNATADELGHLAAGVTA